MWGSWGRDRVTYHTVTRELGVSVQDAVGGRVVTSSVHGIGTSLVEGRLGCVSYGCRGWMMGKHVYSQGI